MSFASDNTTSVSPEILAALSAVNIGSAKPYGGDAVSERVTRRLCEVFETQAAVFPVATGTAANVLCLSAMTPPWGAIYCHEEAHVNNEECGAPEFYTGGAKLIPLPGADGKLAPETVARVLEKADPDFVHAVKPAALTLTNAGEAGTVYRPEEIAALAEVAHAHGVKVHVDGARFANALVACGCTPAELTWKVGVDALSFGATKNGAMAAEAVVLFDRTLAETLPYRRKRGGHLFSKMRYLSAQLEAYLADDLWLENARHANAMAARLAEELGKVPGFTLLHPVEANLLFVQMPEAAAQGLEEAGFAFYRWSKGDPVAVRLVTAFDTAPEDVEGFVEAARRAVEGGG